MTKNATSKRAAACVCRECGFTSAKWFGRCPDCSSWEVGEPPAAPGGAEVVTLAAARPPAARIVSGIGEADRVLGGGLVPGALVLLAGEPGIGKSTLVLQLLGALAAGGRKVLLVSGEESLAQVAARAARLGLDPGGVRALTATALPDIAQAFAAERPEVVVVDSVQTLADPATEGAPGAPLQVRACAGALGRLAKAGGAAVVLVGHVTKDGSVAGPKALEHVVDVVLLLEGERSGSLRLVRALKNRFGSCEETGVFAMSSSGLTPVPDPSALLLADRNPEAPGTVVFAGLEGNRPVLVELQALVAKACNPAQARRVALGVDGRRLVLLLAVMARRAGLQLGELDVFVAAVGGLAVREPAADLPLVLALVSALANVALPSDLVAFGEVGLTGEVRRVPGIERRLAEAARHGFARALVPPGSYEAPGGIEVVGVADLRAACGYLRRAAPRAGGNGGGGAPVLPLVGGFPT